DVLGPDDAGDGQLAHLAVGAHFLPTLDDQVAVGHDGGDDSGHRQVDPLRAVDAAGAVGVHGAFGADHVGGVETAGEGAAQAVLQPEEVGHPARGAVGAIALGRVLCLGAVGDVDGDGVDVADAARALVAEEAARAGAPEAVGAGRGRLRQIGLLDRDQGGRIADGRQFRALNRLDGGGAGGQRERGQGQGDQGQRAHDVSLAQRAANCCGLRRAIWAAGPATARPGPTATASMVRLDWTFRIGTASPAEALRVALPVTVSSTPSLREATSALWWRALTWGEARSRWATGEPARKARLACSPITTSASWGAPAGARCDWTDAQITSSGCTTSPAARLRA